MWEKAVQVAPADTFLLVILQLQTGGDNSFEKCELIHALQWTVNALILHSARSCQHQVVEGRVCVCVCVYANESCYHCLICDSFRSSGLPAAAVFWRMRSRIRSYVETWGWREICGVLTDPDSIIKLSHMTLRFSQVPGKLSRLRWAVWYQQISMLCLQGVSLHLHM